MNCWIPTFLGSGNENPRGVIIIIVKKSTQRFLYLKQANIWIPILSNNKLNPAWEIVTMGL